MHLVILPPGVVQRNRGGIFKSAWGAATFDRKLFVCSLSPRAFSAFISLSLLKKVASELWHQIVHENKQAFGIGGVGEDKSCCVCLYECALTLPRWLGHSGCNFQSRLQWR